MLHCLLPTPCLFHLTALPEQVWTNQTVLPVGLICGYRAHVQKFLPGDAWILSAHAISEVRLAEQGSCFVLKSCSSLQRTSMIMTANLNTKLFLTSCTAICRKLADNSKHLLACAQEYFSSGHAANRACKLLFLPFLSLFCFK